MSDPLLPPALSALAERVVRWRGTPYLTYASPVACVAAGTVVRFALWPLVGDSLFFTTYFPAIALAALIGGLVPGLVALLLSSLAAWYIFMPPHFSLGMGKNVLIQVVVFLPVGGMLVLLATFVNHLLGRLLNQRDLIEEQKSRQANDYEVHVGELHHRIANLFGLVQGIALQTFRADQSLDQSRTAFRDRIAALARASTTDFGLGQTLLHLIEDQLEAYRSQVKVSHCEHVQLTVEATQQLALVLHELATNSAKYGALSRPTGRVEVRCEIHREEAPPSFTLRWAEFGGPPVSPPSRRGFGTAVLKQVPEHSGARVSLDYAADGFRYEYSTTLSRMMTREQ